MAAARQAQATVRKKGKTQLHTAAVVGAIPNLQRLMRNLCPATLACYRLWHGLQAAGLRCAEDSQRFFCEQTSDPPGDPQNWRLRCVAEGRLVRRRAGWRCPDFDRGFQVA